MRRIANKAACLLLAVWLLAGLTLPAAWAAPAGEVAISSAEDLLDFAKNCSLDTWSQGRTVRLTADIDLSGRTFAPIPTFGGTFLGDGHAISGLRITASGSSIGLFRYLQAGAVVQDLQVSGSVAPGGSRSSVGGIAGVNAGAIRNCAFQGTVKGDAAVGGIVGRNEEAGEVAACSVSGTVTGESATGGVAGRNLGILLKCESSASVNTNDPDTSSSLEDLASGSPLEVLTANSDDSSLDTFLDSHTDTGGVVGYSSGVVQSCSNTGTVGYPHVGYNVGGVAGRQTGYLAGCSNAGTVYGRKDVGGIVGQAEPYVALDASGDTLARLRRELDTLDSLLNRALDDAAASGDDISARLTAIGGCTDAARDHSQVLLNGTSDFIDGNIDSLNTLSASVTDALDGLEPALDDLSAAAGRMETLSDRLEDALDALGGAADAGGAMADASGALADLRLAGNSMQAAVQALDDALDALRQAVVVKDETAVNGALADLSAAAEALGGSLEQAGAALDALREALNGSVPGDGDIQAAVSALSASLSGMGGALADAGRALAALSGNTELDWTKLQEALPPLRTALENAKTAAGHLMDAMADLQAALKDAGGLSSRLGDALKKLGDTASLAAGLSRKLESAFDTLHSVAADLAADGPIEFTPLGQEIRDASDGLFSSLSDLAGEMSGLQSAVSGAGDALSADLRAVSRQLNTVFDVVADALAEVRDGTDADSESIIEDTSDQDIAATRQGKITGCRNTGAVDGDRNVGGVVGSMSIEYDLDPEDDIQRFSLGSTYETKAVLEDSVNRGAVTAKKDCAGGLVGHMGLGTTLNCQNYGDITSTSGSYVGGVAGWADATVRDSYAKCVLSGADYVGGIAGWADRLTGCYAIVNIAEGTECVGAIAGSADLEDGVLRNNRFVDTGTAGIDGISYAGIAEPVAFEALRELPGVPTEFVSFTLTLTADGETVARIPFYYGDDLSLVELPEVPEQTGCYGAWPAFDTSGLHSDITLEAVYTPWVTLVASSRQEGKLALALAEGQFTGDAVLEVADSVHTPPAAENQDRETDVWDVTLSGTDLGEDDAVPLRLLNRGGGSATVWQLVNGQWQTVEATANGHYLLLTMTGTAGTFCVRSNQGGPLLALLAAAAALVLLAVLLVGKRLRKKKTAKAADKAAV
nr:GLUG motif-containing protein [uncultured Oscillibacter sp.]